MAFLSGGADGEIRIWDLPRQKTLWTVYAHSTFVRGIVVAKDGASFFSCSDDKTIKNFRLAAFADEEERGADDEDLGRSGYQVEPLNTWKGDAPFSAIDHSWNSTSFASGARSVDVWDIGRSKPIQSFTWGADSIIALKYNPSEYTLIASTASDNSICLYDTRSNTAVRKVIMALRSNSVAWNPMEPLNFTVANEDHCCYSFDMRKLDKAINVHKDHVSAVMSIAYAPTGLEFVTGSYDRTVRIFNAREGRSREVYHTTRMQRVFCVNYSADNKYVVSGSDDTNLRLWKAQASKPLGRLAPAQRRKMEYEDKLKKRFSSAKEVSRIAKHRHVPKNILKAAQKKDTIYKASLKRLQHKQEFAKEGEILFKSERTRNIVKEME